MNGALPATTIDGSVYKGERVADAIGSSVGLSLHVLRRLAYELLPNDGDTRRARFLFDVEVLSGDTERHEWTPAERINTHATNTTDRAALDAFLSAPTERRPPWQQPGWHADTLAWLDEHLGRAGLARTQPARLVHTWQISVLYEITTTSGRAYLKSVPDFFAREAPLTAWLAANHPTVSPPVLAIDETRRLLLLGHAGELDAGDTTDHATRVFRTLAVLQRHTAARVAELHALGCPDRTLSVLQAHARDLLGDDDALLADGRGLEPDEVRALRSLEPRLRADMRRLEELVPATALVHGDLHRYNTVTTGHHDVILDWSDGAVSHPFLDARPAYFLHDEPAPHALDAMRDAYLHAWRDTASSAALREAFGLAQPIGELYCAVSYRRFIVPGVENRAEWDTAHVGHLRNVLKHYA